MKYGHIKDSIDFRDRHHPIPFAFEKLPESVDLRDKMPPVFDQGQLGSCTSNAIVAMREYYNKSELSRLFLYYQERSIEGTISTDSGAQIRDGIKALQKIGVCPEKYDPYVIANFAKTPSPQAYADAGAYKITSYQRVGSISAAKLALSRGNPVVIGFTVYESFEGIDKTGIMSMPKRGEKVLGGHAVLLVGYDSKSFIVRNSWGPEWGQAGYFIMSYKIYRKLVSDAWTGE